MASYPGPRYRPPTTWAFHLWQVVSWKSLFVQVHSEKTKNGRPAVPRSTHFAKLNSCAPCRKHRAPAPALDDVTRLCGACISYLTFLGLQIPNHEWCGQLDPVGMNPKAPVRFFQGYRTTGWQTDIQHLYLHNFSKHVQMLFSNVQINAKYIDKQLFVIMDFLTQKILRKSMTSLIYGIEQNKTRSQVHRTDGWLPEAGGGAEKQANAQGTNFQL